MGWNIPSGLLGAKSWIILCFIAVRAALQITRMALNAFAVSNRRDVYVLQDVKETGEETIFYLR